MFMVFSSYSVISQRFEFLQADGAEQSTSTADKAKVEVRLDIG
jgi:hypothetical protein